MTAMVDVVFFLLIFFMVTSFNAQQASIEMPVPTPSSGAGGAVATKRTFEDFESDQDYLIVRIDADDTVWVEDAETFTTNELLHKLREGMRGEGKSEGPRKLLIMADGDASHGVAVMVLDAGHEAGIEDIRLAIKDDDQ